MTQTMSNFIMLNSNPNEILKEEISLVKFLISCYPENQAFSCNMKTFFFFEYHGLKFTFLFNKKQ